MAARKARQHREAPEIGAMLRRMLRAMARRAGEGDLLALRELVELRAVIDQAIVDGARLAHGDPHRFSWAEIGAELGISRLAAQQRVPRGGT